MPEYIPSKADMRRRTMCIYCKNEETESIDREGLVGIEVFVCFCCMALYTPHTKEEWIKLLNKNNAN